MKTSLRLIGLLCAANAGTLVPLSLAGSDGPPNGYAVRAVEHHNTLIVERGTSEFTVRRLLGEPVRKLGPDTWSYHRYRTVPAQPPGERDCGILVITFTGGKVSDLKLVTASAEKVIAATLRTGDSRTRVTAK